MSSKLWALVLASAAFLGGCSTPSVHPIWSKEKDFADPALVGAWRPAEKDAHETYTLSRAGEWYHLVYEAKDAKDTREFDVRLVQLGKLRFADIAMPESAQRELGDKWDGFEIRTHMFLRYTIEGDHLRIWCLDRKEFLAGIEAKRYTLPYTALDGDSILITADTADLQAFLERHAEDKDLFSSADLERIKP